MRRASVCLAGLALVAGLGLSGCGDDDKDSGKATTSTAAGDSGTTSTTAGETPVAMQELKIEAHDFGFDGLPKEIKGGTSKITFTNNGAVPHDIAFVQVDKGSTVDQFMKDFAPIFEGGPTPDYVGALVAPVAADPGETSTSEFMLEPGTYIAICGQTGDPAKPKNPDGSPGDGEVHMMRGMAQLVTVTEGGSDAPLSEPDGTVTSSDYAFDLDISAGDKVIRFANKGPKEDHLAVFMEFPAGTTEDQAKKALDTLFSLGENEAPPAGTPMPEEVGFSGILSPGPEVNFTMPKPFEAGRVYAAICFISDRAGGPPHVIAHQMSKVFTVS